MGIVWDHLLPLAEELRAVDILLEAMGKANEMNPFRQTRERLESERRHLVLDLDRRIREHGEHMGG